MKKLLTVFMIVSSLALLISTFTGCENQPDNTEQKSEIAQSSSIDNDTREGIVEFEHLSKRGDYNLIYAKVLHNNQLLLCYLDGEFYQFATYDMNKKKIINISEVGQFHRLREYNIKILSNNFYIVSQSTCYIYNFSCDLVKTVPVPEETLSRVGNTLLWLSNDLSKIAYTKDLNNQGTYLYISDLDGNKERQIYEIGAELSITELFFSTDDDCLGFEGVTIPSGQQLSVDCYGYFNLNDDKTTIIPNDDTFVSYVGDIMLIQDKIGEYNSDKTGKIKLLDLRTKKTNEIVLKYPDESEFSFLGIKPEYLVGMHKNEDSRQLSFTIYKDGKEVSSAEYQCSSEQQYTDITAAGTKIEMDDKAQEIFLFYYDSQSDLYTIQSIKYIGE